MKKFLDINQNAILNTNEIMHDYEFYYKLIVLNEKLDFTLKEIEIVG